MTYAPANLNWSELAPILGPCRCMGCGETLWWAKRNTRRMGQTVLQARWREDDGTIHYCPEAPGRTYLRAIAGQHPEGRARVRAALEIA